VLRIWVGGRLVGLCSFMLRRGGVDEVSNFYIPLIQVLLEKKSAKEREREREKEREREREKEKETERKSMRMGKRENMLIPLGDEAYLSSLVSSGGNALEFGRGLSRSLSALI
jgi:hypothetical protein